AGSRIVRSLEAVSRIAVAGSSHCGRSGWHCSGMLESQDPRLRDPYSAICDSGMLEPGILESGMPKPVHHPSRNGTRPMTEKTVAKVAMNERGVLRRRGFLGSVGLGTAAVLAGPSFTDLFAVHADELRKREMACILLWMQGGPSQFETFDPKPDHTNGGGTRT